MEKYFESLASFDIWAKVVIGILTAPFWIPALRTIWSELTEALAEDNELQTKGAAHKGRRRPPELDPFLNVPHEHLVQDSRSRRR